jgi:hypothetical protein
MPPPRVVNRGWLTKEGAKVRNWKRRFFTLDSRSLLRYYKTEDTTARCAGQIDLARCLAVVTGVACACPWPEDAEPRLCFGIVLNARTYHVRRLRPRCVTVPCGALPASPNTPRSTRVDLRHGRG